MLTLDRLLELAGLRDDSGSHDQVLRIFTDAIDHMAMRAMCQLYEVDFHKLEKLRTLANHPNTPPHERAAALAAIQRLLPPRPPQPDVPQGGYANKGKLFSPGQPDEDKPQPRPSSYTTARGKTFS
jgi:hypothetical protein